MVIETIKGETPAFRGRETEVLPLNRFGGITDYAQYPVPVLFRVVIQWS